MTKVTLFILKSTNFLYAYSINKEYIKTFKFIRNMNLFNIKELEFNEYELMLFNNKYHQYMLISDYLYDGENNIEMICTNDESNSLSDSCDYINRTFMYIFETYRTYPLYKKYLKAIERLTDSIIINFDDLHNPELSINTFKLFCHLNQKTFCKNYDVN